MSVGYKIYKIIKKQILDNTDITTITYKDINEKIENCISVNVSFNQVAKTRKLNDALYSYEVANTMLKLQSYKSKSGILKNEQELEIIRDKLLQIHNKIFLFKDDELTNISEEANNLLQIGQIDLITDIVYLGKSEFEIPRYTIRLRISCTSKTITN